MTEELKRSDIFIHTGDNVLLLKSDGQKYYFQHIVNQNNCFGGYGDASGAITDAIRNGYNIINYATAITMQKKLLQDIHKDDIFISSSSGFYTLKQENSKYIFRAVGSKIVGHSGFHETISDALITALACPGTKIVPYCEVGLQKLAEITGLPMGVIVAAHQTIFPVKI